MRQACAVALRPRISSNTSGLRFCGMIEEPVVKASGSLDEAELAGREQEHVGGEAAEILHQQRDLEQQLRFGLAARELHGGDRLVHLREAELRCVASRSIGSPGVP